MLPSRFVSLDLFLAKRRINYCSLPFEYRTVTIHRFEETIGGHVYLIEVLLVSNRWRAQLLRTKGVPTAMMPFYGRTPDEAARQLTGWLTLAHQRQTLPAV